MPDAMLIPDSYEMLITEDLVLPFDPSNLLASGEQAVPTTSTLRNVDTQTTITLAHGPAVTTLINGSSVITQRIVGGTDVTTAGRYRLEVSFLATPTTNVYTLPLDLQVRR